MSQTYIDELLLIIRSDKTNEEKEEELKNYHENDIALVFPFLTKEERLNLYRILDQDVISDIFSYLDEPTEYLEELSSDDQADIIENMDADDAIDILEDMEAEDRDEIIGLMEKDAVEDIVLIKSYEEGTIGSIMTTNYIAISKNASVKKAMKTMINEAATNDNVSTLYFVDENDVFYGAMDLRDLIIARDGTPLDDLIKTSYPAFKANSLVSDCLERLKDYALDSIPVLDHEDHLIGVITSDDIVQIVQEEMNDDYAKLGGLSGIEDLNEPIYRSMLKRMPWLFILLGLGLVTSLLISAFEPVVKALPLIVFFQSLILDMAGNTGTQSLAVTIRVLSSEYQTKKEIRKLIFKEIRVGFFNGLVIGIASFTAVLLFLLLVASKDNDIAYNLKVSMTVGVSMLCSMMVASCSGSLIPVILKKCKIDPAVASGPLITTLNDVIAVTIYYGLSWILFTSLIK